ncbi:hypothetical protein T492DRAFT_1070808 [Pavlovales sp. CCMP2436]|nr:hypothetical protein T492DRAFT_1070808 [Pavlovales sp. CCMP2436]
MRCHEFSVSAAHKSLFHSSAISSTHKTTPPPSAQNVIVKFAKMIAYFAVAIGLLDSDMEDDDKREELKHGLVADAEKAKTRDRLRVALKGYTEANAAQLLSVYASGQADMSQSYLGLNVASGSTNAGRKKARTTGYEGHMPATQERFNGKGASACRLVFNLVGFTGKYVGGTHRSGNPFSSEAVSQLLLSRRKQAVACGE